MLRSLRRRPSAASRAARHALAAASVALLACPTIAAGEVLLRDDFDGTALDTALWVVPTGPGTFFGRTQIRPPSVPLEVTGGVIRLQLDTFNPSALVPGDSFFGSEIDSIETWAVETGLSFRARVRLAADVPGGLVGSVFSFVFHPGPGTRDEIDFELLSNDVVASNERVLTNVFDDDDFAQPGDKAFASVSGLDLTQFHEYEVRWYRDRVEWWIDGALVRDEDGTVPDDPQNVRLNFWAPDAFFAEAYDGSLVPAASAGANETWYYEVDFVEIRRLDPAVPALGPAALLLALLALPAAAWSRLRVTPRRAGPVLS